MTQSGSIRSDEQIVDAMTQLARAAKSHRVIVAGSNSAQVFLELRRRGFPRVATTKTRSVPCGQYDVALVVWKEHSFKVLETALARLVHFLTAAGVLVIWIGSRERMPNRALRLALERLSFRIEAATSCESGVAIAAQRIDSRPAAKAA
jgi:acetolactate synthase regulatory subunit